MIYKDFQNLRLPMLGFGSMRLPLLPGGGDGDVDEAAVAEMDGCEGSGLSELDAK